VKTFSKLAVAHTSDNVMKLRLQFLTLCPKPDLHRRAATGWEVCCRDAWQAARAAAGPPLGVPTRALPLRRAHSGRRLGYTMARCY